MNVIKYIQIKEDTYAIDPCNHASDKNEFGLATSNLYGHTKIINDFTSGEDTDGRALSAYAGYVLNRMEYAVIGRHTYDGYAYFTIPYPLPEKSSSTIVAGGWYKKDGDSGWTDINPDFDFYYNSDGILVTPKKAEVQTYDYKIVILVR